MSKFDDYVRIILETVGWRVDKTVNKKDEPRVLPLDFINDLDTTAKKYGYEADSWGESTEKEKRVVMFVKIKD